MNVRILRTELRRSAAPWTGLAALVIALGFLSLLTGPWHHGTVIWTQQWTSNAWWDRFVLTFLWPLAVGAGALQGLRDHRSRMPELLSTTPRPAWHRAAKSAGASALVLTVAAVLLLAAGAAQVARNEGYFHLSWLPLSAIGLLGLVAGAWFGMGVGRALPSVLTPPVLAVAALVAMAYLSVAMDAGSKVEGSAPARLPLLSPALPELPDPFLNVTGRVDLAQSAWLLGIAVTGFLLLAATTLRRRLVGLLPLAVGAVVALPLLPSTTSHAYAVDSAVTAPVCRERVCVTALHKKELKRFEGPGRAALRKLAKLPDPPDSVRESAPSWPPAATQPRNAHAIPVDFNTEEFDLEFRKARGTDLERALLAGAGTPSCLSVEDEGGSRTVRESAARTVAAAWFLGDLKPLPGLSWTIGGVDKLARPAWKALRAQPAQEQRRRIEALRKAALSCDGTDLLDVLKGSKEQGRKGGSAR